MAMHFQESRKYTHVLTDTVYEIPEKTYLIFYYKMIILETVMSR